MSRAAAALAVLVASGATTACGDEPTVDRSAASGETPLPRRTTTVVDQAPTDARRARSPWPRGASGWAVWVRRPVPVRHSPGGSVVGPARTRTPFATDTVLPVVARQGPWVGVLSIVRPGRVVWARLDERRLRAVPLAARVEVDRSERRLRVRRGGRVVLRAPVAVGAVGSPTPLGRFAVTDDLLPPAGSPYGRRILALSARQPRLPASWPGGDRLALHGTVDESSVGSPASLGCLRLRDADLQRLARLARPGTEVRITA